MIALFDTFPRLYIMVTSMEDSFSTLSESQNLPTVVSQDSKNIALLMWLGTIFFSFIPALVIYLIK